MGIDACKETSMDLKHMKHLLALADERNFVDLKRVEWMAPPALHRTIEPPEGSDVGKKLEVELLVPVMVNGRAAPPATAVKGLIELKTGGRFGGGLMVKKRELEKPLLPVPDAGLRVYTLATPGLATKAAGTVAVTRFPRAAPVLSTATVVARGLPFHCTTVFSTKPPPWMESVKSPLPALICEGERKETKAPVLF